MDMEKEKEAMSWIMLARVDFGIVESRLKIGVAL